MTRIATVADLEAVLGPASLGTKMKVIDHLDDTAAQWVAASPIAFLGFGDETGPSATLAGGPAGFARVADPHTLAIPLSAIDAPGPIAAGQGAAVLFLAPGVGETLRGSGKVAAIQDAELLLTLDECFVHCAKALIRSDFWAGGPATVPNAPEAFIGAARFLALVTMSAGGRVEVSPKGDPPGRLLQIESGRLTLAERPGNRLAFGYRNIIDQPKVAAIAVSPGSETLAVLTGRAELTTDEEVRARFVVEDRQPIMATVIALDSADLRQSPTLSAARLWSGLPDSGIDPAATLVAHIKLNREQGVEATMIKLAVKRDTVAGGLAANYKAALY